MARQIPITVFVVDADESSRTRLAETVRIALADKKYEVQSFAAPNEAEADYVQHQDKLENRPLVIVAGSGEHMRLDLDELRSKTGMTDHPAIIFASAEHHDISREEVSAHFDMDGSLDELIHGIRKALKLSRFPKPVTRSQQIAQDVLTRHGKWLGNERTVLTELFQDAEGDNVQRYRRMNKAFNAWLEWLSDLALGKPVKGREPLDKGINVLRELQREETELLDIIKRTGDDTLDGGVEAARATDWYRQDHKGEPPMTPGEILEQGSGVRDDTLREIARRQKDIAFLGEMIAELSKVDLSDAPPRKTPRRRGR